MKFFFLIHALTIFSFKQAAAQSPWDMLKAGISDPNSGAIDISAPNKNTCWAIGANLNTPAYTCGYVFREYTRTGDGGKTFKTGSIILPVDYSPVSICAIDSNTAWIASQDIFAYTGGRIYKTINGGTTWTYQSTAVFNEYANFVHFFNANEGIAIGDSLIYKTMDGGTNWTKVYNTFKPLGYSINCNYNAIEVRGNHVWFGHQRLFYSSDRGNTWTLLKTNIYPDLYKGIAFKDSLNGIAVAAHYVTGGSGGGGWTDDGNLYITNDGGNTWRKKYIKLPGSYFGKNYDIKYHIAYIPGSKNSYILNAERGSFPFSFITHDSATTWQALDTSGRKFLDLAIIDSNTAYCGTFFTNSTTGIYKWKSNTAQINDLNKKPFSFSIYPNPTKNELNIQLNSIQKSIKYSILNLVGTTILTGNLSNSNAFKIVLQENTNPGVYLLNLKSEQGYSTKTFRVE